MRRSRHPVESIFTQGAAQGIGFYFSSGDSGDDDAAWGVKGTDYPASDPFVTSVGGTALGINQDGTFSGGMQDSIARGDIPITTADTILALYRLHH